MAVTNAYFFEDVSDVAELIGVSAHDLCESMKECEVRADCIIKGVCLKNFNGFVSSGTSYVKTYWEASDSERWIVANFPWNAVLEFMCYTIFIEVSDD